MKKQVSLLLMFTVSYVNSHGEEGTWNYYAKLFPSGTIRVFNPSCRAYDCEKANYYSGKVSYTFTNKGNRYFNLHSILNEFINIAIKQVFFPFREIHYGYNNPYIPQVVMKVKFDDGLYEKPIQIKAAYNKKWICVDSVSKHLVIDENFVKRSLRDE